MPDPIGIVLLAAGRGTRFGEAAKMLGLLDGKPLVRHAAECAVAANLGPVAVVLGAHGAAVRQALAGLDLRMVDNPAYAEGMSTSLRCGLDALPEPTAIIVMLGDMPRIRPAHLATLAASFVAADPAPAAIVPVHRGARGNPVLLNRALLARDLTSLGGDQGAGRLLAARTDVVELEMDAAVTLDIDTQAALIDAARA
ncbi:NTP transferase domain-containing protein [Methylobacterium sp. E-045]|uniref:nucleotidyltransferase family protein n=1 Tax=Methylobacterium sp. E-045 TaxID=2836575 RepID=UPI001FBBC7C8|nr:nucleotidyltransferase family protein [Methylobacterium sp. E-045]MCJ2130081.1 nucleotidyltransferase family protein [Methylobacterium sp. E-045]